MFQFIEDRNTLLRTAILFLGLTSRVWAQFSVDDPTTHVLIQENTQSQLSKWADSLAKLDEQIKRATDQVNRLTDLKNFIGNPASTLLPGDTMGALGSIYKSSTSIYRNVNQLQSNVSSLGQSISSGSILGLYTPQDAIYLFEDEAYRYDAVRYKRYHTAAAAADNADSTNTDTIQQIDRLNDQITSLQQQLNAATTQAQTDKLNGLITSTQSKIAALEARRRAAVDTQAILYYQNMNDAEEKKAKASEGMAQGLAGAQDKVAGAAHHMSAIPGR